MNITRQSRVAILGFGREGVSTYFYLKRSGVVDITILDVREISAFDPEERNILEKEHHILGASYLDVLDGYDAIIKAPGISPYHSKILPYRHVLSSQTQIFCDVFQGKIIAVTWTKGKSTTTSLIYAMLHAAWFHVGIVGNIGNPVLDTLENNYDYVVFEMSSYMLDGVSIDPYISVLVNLYPEHLDYHLGFENYKRAKLGIIWQHSYVVYNHAMRALLEEYNNEKISFWKCWQSTLRNEIFSIGEVELFSREKVQLMGDHNLENIMAVIAAWDYMHIPTGIMENAISHFSGLPHRLEKVNTKNGIIFYDDAISTTPESTIAAIRSLSWVDTIFLGGSDRWYDFHLLAKEILSSSIRNVVFFPDTGARIEAELTRVLPEFHSRYHFIRTASMKAAVDFAFQHTLPWSICLLSCASPSYSNWKNFEAKWEEFQKYIEEYNAGQVEIW